MFAEEREREFNLRVPDVLWSKARTAGRSGVTTAGRGIQFRTICVLVKLVSN